MKLKILICTSFLLFNISIAPQPGWNFINPKPTGFTIWDIDRDNSDRLWIVGEYGTVFNTNFTSDWDKVDLGTNTHFTGITFKEEKGWIIGTDGVIYQSENSGQNWHLKNSGTSKNLKQVHFLNENVGWIIGVDSLMLHTTDGGNNWDIDTLDYGLQTGAYAWPWNQVLFQNEEVGWLLVGYYFPGNLGIDPESGGALLKTTNGGETWAILDSGDTKYTSIYFLNDSIGWLTTKSVNNGIRFFSTSNGGGTWILQPSTPEWREIYFIDELIGWGISGTFIGKTTNSGLTWTIDEYMEPPGPGDGFKGLMIDNYTEGWCAGSSGFILSTTDGGNSWQNFDERLDIYYASLKDVAFVNESDGWAVGQQYLDGPNDSAIVIHTTDGGYSWERQIVPGVVSLYRIWPISNETLWIIANNKVLYTENGGDEWQIKNVPPTSWIYRDIFFFGSQVGFILGSSEVFKTTDGGISWVTITGFQAQFLRKIEFVNINRGWVLTKSAGGNYRTYITQDGGLTWNLYPIQFTAITFLDSFVGYSISEGLLYKTTDAGENWNLVTVGGDIVFSWLTNIIFPDEKHGWAWNWNEVYKTIDSGITWSLCNGITNIGFGFPGGLFMLSKDFGWAVGSDGYIFKFTSDSVSSIEYVELVNPSNYILSQNYPNPFNPKTTINYHIPELSFVTLRVYDVLGSEIATLVKEEKQVGSYEVEFNTTALPSGIYFYRLQAGFFVETKKMVLMK